MKDINTSFTVADDSKKDSLGLSKTDKNGNLAPVAAAKLAVIGATVGCAIVLILGQVT